MTGQKGDLRGVAILSAFICLGCLVIMITFIALQAGERTNLQNAVGFLGQGIIGMGDRLVTIEKKLKIKIEPKEEKK